MDTVREQRMARGHRKQPEKDVEDYRHDATRKNNPPAGLAAQGMLRERPKQSYSYDPHRPPVLRFDETGASDKLPELLEIAQQRALKPDEARMLAEALRNHKPWLEWSGKREARSFEVNPVALHIHERISAKAVLRVAARQDIQRDLFADPQQEYREAVQFYQHDVDWSNRLILGDSLAVMSSLARREDLAGKVQMIYIDPPYGIKHSSNFQPTVFQRSVGDSERDLTREPEQIKAYRDTWALGIHSYLAYLRDRLITARELLTDSGSIFFQISDENVHRVRSLLDDVFGSDNFISLISFQKTGGLISRGLVRTVDYLCWYAKNAASVKVHQLYLPRRAGDTSLDRYDLSRSVHGELRRLTPQEKYSNVLPKDQNRCRQVALESANPRFEFEYHGQSFSQRWKTNAMGLGRLGNADRLVVAGKRLNYIRYVSDFPVIPLTDRWESVQVGRGLLYVVQTAETIIRNCMLMTTDPGDLVLDPTCGGGTAAHVAEQWGRRWITIDTSRVAIALARQRLLTASFDYYEVQDEARGISGGLKYKTVPHITLKSIAQNVALDPIFEKYEPILAEKLKQLNGALQDVVPQVRTTLLTKLVEKEKKKGKRSITDADTRRWKLPTQVWQEWEVPFDTDPDWPPQLQESLTEYREVWRAKMDEVNECIAASADQEVLVDQPEVDRKKLRVSGPFTVEAVQPIEEFLDTTSSIDDDILNDLETFEDNTIALDQEPANVEAHLEQMLRLLRNDGVRFPENKVMNFAQLEPVEGDVIHAEGSWEGDEERLVGVVFGPQHGPVTVMQVEQCLPIASRRGYSDLVFAGFSFEGAAQAIIQDDPNPRVRVHMAHINPDVAMGDLLKETPSSQLFTVFGLPRTSIRKTKDSQYVVTMEGVDVYNPLDNTVIPTGANKVAAWFLDSDYDGRTFCITQAFFPDKSAWQKIARALKGVMDGDRFEAFSGTKSLPFPAGDHQCVAVKVIDPRGNEVMRIHSLKGGIFDG